MQKYAAWFERAYRPFFLVTGAGTALIGLFAFAPTFAMANVAKLPYLQEYTIIIQHWGIMVMLMGLFMMASAVIPAWRTPIAVYSGIEKSFMVWLVLSHLRQPFSQGFMLPLILDTIVVLFTIAYFAACGLRWPAAEPR